MSWDKIVPSILDQAPAEVLEIKYPTFEIELGQELKPSDLVATPTYVNWANIDPNGLYTMVLVDCDPEDAAQYHFKQVNLGMTTNIPGGYVAQGYITSPYSPPRPKEGSGLHRYLVVIFKQPGTLFGVPFAIDESQRHNFDVRDFAKAFSLGLPVAGTYFVAQADQSSIDYWVHHYSFSKSGSVLFKCNIL